MGVGVGEWGKWRQTFSIWGWGDECGCWLGWIGGASGAECQDEAEEDAVELRGGGTVPIGQVMEVC